MTDRITRLLIRRGVWNEDRELDEDTGDDPSLLEHLQAASIKQLALTGPRAGQPIQRLGTGLAIPACLGHLGPRRARLEGFDLHADTAVRAHNRKRLERLCTYLLRPPISEKRLELRRGKVRLQLKTAWRDSSTHLELEPTELLERLAALVPLPHKNLLVYHGVLAADARWRSGVVAFGRPQTAPSPVDACGHGPNNADPAAEPPPTPPHRPNPTWAELMRRGLDIDALDCPKCHGRMKFIATISSPHAIARILTHLGLPSDPIRPAPARGPPSVDDDCIDVAWATIAPPRRRPSPAPA